MTLHHTTLGFEIEYLRGAPSLVDDVLANIRQAGADNNKPSLSNVSDQRNRYSTTYSADRWIQAYDSSCGWEIKSQPLRDTSEVEDVMRGIRMAGGRVNRSCGLHVHVGCAHLSVPQLFRLAKLYARYERALELLVAPSRRLNSTYCVSNFTTIPDLRYKTEGDSIEDYFDRLDRERQTVDALARICAPNGKYSKMNMGSPFRKYGTVEFRAHQGTLNFKKIDAWSSLLVAMVKMAEGTSTIKPTIASFEEMLDELIDRENTIKRPKEGTKGRMIWDAMDALQETGDTRLFSPDGRVRFQNTRSYLMASLNMAQSSVHGPIQRWARSKGLTRRVSQSSRGLRSYLEARRAELA